MIPSAQSGACDACLARAWLLARLSGHLDKVRAHIWELLALSDEGLIDAVAGSHRESVLDERASFDGQQAAAYRRRAAAAELELVCGCTSAYPEALRDLAAPPHVLHVVGGVRQLQRLCAADPVALVGARRASGYGREVARMLARNLARAGVSVVSGLAAGIDASAHRGALEGHGMTAAVLPGPAETPYPSLNAGLYRELVRDQGVGISELGPGVTVRRWMFAARNRLIAALARLTVVVQAAPGSGSLLTVSVAQQLERPVAAVPGQVTDSLSDGPNRLLAEGALMARDAQDLLDALFSAGTRHVLADERAALGADQAAVVAAVTAGLDTPGALLRAGIGGPSCLAQLAALELSGRLRRGPGGRFTVIP